MRFSDPFLRYSVLASIMRIWHPGQRGRSSRLTGKRNGPVIVRPSYLVGRVILKFFFRVVCRRCDEGRGSQSAGVADAFRRLLQYALGHIGFLARGFAILRQKGPCLVERIAAHH